MKNSINEDYGGFLIISPLSTTKKRLPFGSLFLFSYYFAEIIVIGSICTDSYDGIAPIEGSLDFLATFLHFVLYKNSI